MRAPADVVFPIKSEDARQTLNAKARVVAELATQDLEREGHDSTFVKPEERQASKQVVSVQGGHRLTKEANEKASLQAACKAWNLRVVPVLGDGDCLFSCIAMGLNTIGTRPQGDGMHTAANVRHAIAKWIEKNASVVLPGTGGLAVCDAYRNEFASNNVECGQAIVWSVDKLPTLRDFCEKAMKFFWPTTAERQPYARLLPRAEPKRQSKRQKTKEKGEEEDKEEERGRNEPSDEREGFWPVLLLIMKELMRLQDWDGDSLNLAGEVYARISNDVLRPPSDHAQCTTEFEKQWAEFCWRCQICVSLLHKAKYPQDSDKKLVPLVSRMSLTHASTPNWHALYCCCCLPKEEWNVSEEVGMEELGNDGWITEQRTRVKVFMQYAAAGGVFASPSLQPSNEHYLQVCILEGLRGAKAELGNLDPCRATQRTDIAQHGKLAVAEKQLLRVAGLRFAKRLLQDPLVVGSAAPDMPVGSQEEMQDLHDNLGPCTLTIKGQIHEEMLALAGQVKCSSLQQMLDDHAKFNQDGK